MPDAIKSSFARPFQYFGVADSVDLTGLAWQRGGYRVDDLDRLYTGNDIRAKLVLEKLSDTVLNLADVRGLAFASVLPMHDFMARFFNDNGVSSIALSAQSNDEERNSAQQRLRDRTINFIFVVDLYNEVSTFPKLIPWCFCDRRKASLYSCSSSVGDFGCIARKIV